MLANIKPSIENALGQSLTDSGLSRTQYHLSRQIGILRWLNQSTYKGRDYTVGRVAVTEQTVIHNDFFHTYDVWIDNRSVLMQVWIVSVATLAEEYPVDCTIEIDPDYPNLYVAQRSGTDDRIAFEISADETSILHNILSLQSANPFCPIQSLTGDAELQALVMDVQSSLEDRLTRMNMPYVSFGKADDVRLFFPSDVSLYQKQLEWLLQHGDFSHDSLHDKRLPKGEVARRLRELGMFSYSGSIVGVYGKVAKHIPWKEMGLVERASYENRIVGCGVIDADDSNIEIMLIMRDRINDGIGQHIFVSDGNHQVLVTVGIHSEIETIVIHDENITDSMKEKITLTRDLLETQCDNWYDGLRVIPWLAILFEIIEQNVEVSYRSAILTLKEWLLA